MILPKYNNIFNQFLTNYEEIHISPWHSISKKELIKLSKELLSKMDVDNDYSFNYYCNYLIKRLCGLDDAHTKFSKVMSENTLLPFNFKIIDEKVFLTYPINLYGAELIKINDIDIKIILTELENIISYGTIGRKTSELELVLLNRLYLFGLPSLKNFSHLKFEFKKHDKIIEKTFSKNEKLSKEEVTKINEMDFSNNCKYFFKGDCLIYIHKSVQNFFKDQIQQSIENLQKEDFTNVRNIIIDMRGNFGGNSSLNEPLLNFLNMHRDKNLFVITDYKVFSSGRFLLHNLLQLGAISIGDEIGTPMNCFGENKNVNIDGYNFAISKKYFNPIFNIGIDTKENFIAKANEKITSPIYYKPSITIKYTVEDLLEKKDPYIEYIVNNTKTKKLN